MSMLEGFQTFLFLQIKSSFFFFSFSGLLEYSRRIVITVSLCNSIFLATDIWGADIINLVLVHLRMLWHTVQHLCSPGGIYSLPQILTLNILIDMFQKSLNK